MEKEWKVYPVLHIDFNEDDYTRVETLTDALNSIISKQEKQLSQGRADCVIETDKNVYVFEFKLDGTADEALRQTEDKGYVLPYANDSRSLYKIGCSFSSETGTIEGWKVE